MDSRSAWANGLMDSRIMRKSETLLYGGKISDSFDLFTDRESNSAGGHVTSLESISAGGHVSGR